MRTEELIARAGIHPGMRVLDVGCGAGVVTEMLARRLGPQGEVVGIDTHAGALQRARSREPKAMHAPMRFVEADLHEVGASEGSFDAVFGRRVLMYLANPAYALRKLRGALKPGGILAFQEHDGSVGGLGAGAHPLRATVQEWIWATVEAEGGRRTMGMDLRHAYVDAGLPAPTLHVEAMPMASGVPDPLPGLVGIMHGRIVGQGVATEEEIGFDTLADRLHAELDHADAPFVGELAFGAWARA